ncbi:MAG: secondary thiamine-phosphate synthase enzyme YjbQ [Candidatus Aenigmatarchaeota archaeon]
MIYREIIEIETKSNKYIDITNKISDIVENCHIKYGLCHIFLEGTTAGFLLNENDPMLLADFKNVFKKIAPKKKLYQHPSNAFSHIRASMLRQDLTFPINDGKLILGTWQNILLWEFDIKKRKRKIVITISD